MGFLNKIIARVGLDGTEFELGAKKVEGAASKMGENIAHHFKEELAAAFGAAALEEGIRRVIEFGAHISDLSHRLGIGAEAVQVWDFALKQNGSSIDSAAGFFEKLAIARDKAFGGGDMEAIAAFNRLGVAVDDLKGARIEDIAAQIGDVFKAGGDPQQLITALREVGGKSAGEMIPALVAGIKEAKEEAIKLGVILDDQTVNTLKRADDEWTQLKASFMASAAPWVAEWVDGISYGFNIIKTTAAFWGAWLSHVWDNKGDFKGAMAAAIAAGKAVNEAYEDAQHEIIHKEGVRDKQKPVGVDDESIAAAQKIYDLYKELHAAENKNRAAGLNSSQKLLELKRQEKELQQEILDMGKDANGVEGLEKQIKLVNLDSEIAELQKGNLKYESNRVDKPDHLAKMGGFVGSAEQTLANVHRANEHNTRKIALGIDVLVAHAKTGKPLIYQ